MIRFVCFCSYDPASLACRTRGLEGNGCQRTFFDSTFKVPDVYFQVIIARLSETCFLFYAPALDTNSFDSFSSSRYNVLPSERLAISKKFSSPSVGKELKNNHNLISVILVGVLLLFFVVLAVVYLGLGGKNDDIFATEAGRY